MFEGAFTAIVTPFDQSGNVDYPAFEKLINWQIEQGIDRIVPVGTTGESPTLNTDEHRCVIEFAIEKAGGRVKIIAGTGANSTQEALELTTFAKKAGADGTLQVTPYYNKPNQEGLYNHFSAVADIGLPVVLYNVPGRSGREIAVETIARLAAHENVVAVKEAGGSVDRVSQILNRCSICVLSGDDALTFPMMALGAKGVISVSSNIAPHAVAALVHAALEENWTEARKLHYQYYDLFAAMFMDTNPIPVKAAAAMAGHIQEQYRLPLCPLDDALRTKLAAILQRYTIIPAP